MAGKGGLISRGTHSRDAGLPLALNVNLRVRGTTMETQAASRNRIRFGPFEADLQSGELRKHGIKIKLHGQSFKILARLMARPGELITREELHQALWPQDTFVDFETGLNSAVLKLRQALGDSADKPQFVETIPRHGYRFIATLEKPGLEPPEKASEGQRRTPYRLLGGIAAGVLALILLLVAGNVRGLRDRLLGKVKPGPIRSVVVLPFENLTGDPAQGYFADGITDALTTKLAQIGSIRVISRTTAFQYKGSKKTLPQIARELNVDGAIEGSVERGGGRIAIHVQLVRTQTDTHLWAKSYETSLGDVLSLESQVAREVTREMQAQLTPREQARLERTRPVKPEAYEYYLRGMVHHQLENRVDNAAAIDLLERAVAADPNFAQAYAALAADYTVRFVNLDPQQEQWEEKAYAAAQKAISLDPDLAETYVAQGSIMWTLANHFPHEQAVREFQHAVALNPNSAEAHAELAHVYDHIGLLEKAHEELKKSIALDPLNSEWRRRSAVNLIYQGRYEEALTTMQGSGRSFPRLTAFQAAFALFQLGRKEEASARVEEYLRAHPGEPDAGGLMASMKALLAASGGDKTRAEERIQAAVKSGQGYQHFHHAAYVIASAYSLMNKSEPAMAWLERTANEGFPCYPLFERDPDLNNLRQNPRFIQFMAAQKKQWEHFKATL